MATKISGPSIKAMRAAFDESKYGITDAQIARLKAMMDGRENSKVVCDELEIKITYLDRIQRILEIANKWLNCSGVEYAASKYDDHHQSLGLEYCNVGDSYENTLIFDKKTWRFRAGCVGDIIEKDRRFAER